MDPASQVATLLDRGRFDSVRQASRTTNVPRSTIQDRRAGVRPRGRESQPHARLTRDQEDSLAAYIKDLQLQYAPVNHTQLAVIAQAMARQNEPNARLGVNWIYRFIGNRPGLRTGKNQPLAKSRIDAAIPCQIEGWFRHLSEVVLRLNIDPHDIWNMDEIGFQMSHSQRESVVFDRRTRPPLSIASGSTGWVSAIEAISASSDVLMPLVIHRGRKATQPPDCWFPPSEECPNWRWGFTDKGWTNNVYSLEWLREIFIPLTRRGRSIDDKSYWRLLILDGHGSHITGEFIFECLFH